MKRITIATLLSAFAALALGAGCSKSDSSSTRPAPGAEARRDEGPLLPPPGPGLGGGAAGGDQAAPTALSPADRAAIRANRGDRPRAWVGGDELTPEQLEARRAERRLQREERRHELLTAHDADGDGQLSADEREAMRQARITAMHGRVDADGDGRVTKAELEAMTGGERRPGPPFESLDADGDGFLSVEEMRRVRLQRGPRPDRVRGGNGWGEQAPSGTTPSAPGAPAPQ